MTRLTGADIVALCQGVHADNRVAGWWNDPRSGEPLQRNVGELLMLCVSEICEGAEGFEGRLPDDKLPHRPMLEVELADFLTRVFELGDGLGIAADLGDQFDLLVIGGALSEKYGPMSGPNDFLLRMIRFVSEAMEHDRKGRRGEMARPLAFAIHGVFILADHMDFDVMGAVSEKRAFNKTREDHKVENRVKPGGKEY